jgi:hypothetical protein
MLLQLARHSQATALNFSFFLFLIWSSNRTSCWANQCLAKITDQPVQFLFTMLCVLHSIAQSHRQRKLRQLVIRMKTKLWPFQIVPKKSFLRPVIGNSLGLAISSLMMNARLHETYDFAHKSGSIIVVASGNQENIGSISYCNVYVCIAIIIVVVT